MQCLCERHCLSYCVCVCVFMCTTVPEQSMPIVPKNSGKVTGRKRNKRYKSYLYWSSLLLHSSTLPPFILCIYPLDYSLHLLPLHLPTSENKWEKSTFSGYCLPHSSVLATQWAVGTTYTHTATYTHSHTIRNLDGAINTLIKPFL